MAKRKPTIEEVVDSQSFRGWLEALPDAKIKPATVVLAHRLALRVLPFAALLENYQDRQFAPMLMYVLRCSSIARVASTWPSNEIASATASATAASVTAAATVDSAAARVAFAARASAATASAATESAIAFAVDSVYVASASAATSASASAATSAFAASAFGASAIWQSLRQDLDLIEEGLDNEVLLKRPLWEERPRWWIDAWSEMQRNLLTPESRIDRWDIWLSWYENVAHGQPAFYMLGEKFTNLERRIALGDGREGFWDREPGDINREIAKWIDETHAPELDANVDLTQRPAGHIFELEDGKIVAKPVFGTSNLGDIAGDIRKALAAKAQTAAKALQESQAPNHFVESLGKLADFLNNLTNENPALGQLLMHSQTIEADLTTLLSPKFRNHYQEDVLSKMTDVLQSLESYRSLFPQLLKIEAQRVALNLATGDAENVNVQIDKAVARAAKNPIVSQSAIAALDESNSAIIALNDQISTTTNLGVAGESREARAKLVGQRLMEFRNLTAKTLVIVGKDAGKAVYKGTMTGIEKSAESTVKGGALMLVHQIAGPWAAIAVWLSMFAGIAKRAEDVKKNNPDPDNFEV